MPRPPHSQGDLDRIPSIEPDTEFPDYVEIQLVWGKKVRYQRIMADEFFGWGRYGAPMSGDAVIRHIDRMRRHGAPEASSPPTSVVSTEK